MEADKAQARRYAKGAGKAFPARIEAGLIEAIRILARSDNQTLRNAAEKVIRDGIRVREQNAANAS